MPTFDRHVAHRPIAAVLAALGLLAGCGAAAGDSTPGVASVGTDAAGGDDEERSPASSQPARDPEEATLAYSECMRDHGIDLPDPVMSDDGGGMIQMADDIDPTSDEFKEAQEACEPIMADAFGEIDIDPEQEAEMREQLLEYAECMREHGVEMPDPVFGEGGRVEVGADARVGEGDDLSSDEFEAADEACNEGGGFAIGAGPVDEP